ncbi:Rhodanese-like domain-containing protein [Gautieria morchelliformis]|nr:Rhodanese-like domain-containing protein [Gautieria morchelliformis]
MSTTQPAPLLLTPSQASRLSPQKTIFIDASWVMPNSPRKPKEEFTAFRIPTARFLDIDEVASHTDEGSRLGLRHMMPDPQVFAQACENLGITRDSHVILYDTHGLFSSPRALFMFRAFSHTNSSVLNGGLPRWIDEGYQVEANPPNPAELSRNSDAGTVNRTSYPAPSMNETVIRSYSDMVSNSTLLRTDPTMELVLDARPRGRYLGVDPEPRPNLPSGHIPGSFSLPFNQFTIPHKVAADSPLSSYPPYLSSGYTTLRPPQELSEDIRKSLGTDFGNQVLGGERRIVTTCGSGMTAAVLWLGLSSIWEAQQRGAPALSIYDESWTGYAARQESKIVKGEE